MTEAEKLLESIAEKDKERAYLLQQLALWVKVQAQGIDINDVDRFGFATEYLTEAQKRDWKRGCRFRYDPHYLYTYYTKETPDNKHSPMFYNYVRMKGGEVRLLNPMLAIPRKVK